MRTDDIVKVTDSAFSDLSLNDNLNQYFSKSDSAIKVKQLQNYLHFSIYSNETKVIRNVKIQQMAQVFSIYQLLAQQLLPISQPHSAAAVSKLPFHM